MHDHATNSLTQQQGVNRLFTRITVCLKETSRISRLVIEGLCSSVQFSTIKTY